jgi:hypothetical protein
MSEEHDLMPMASRRRSRLLITWILAAVLVGSNGGSFPSKAWAGDPDSADTMPTPVGQLSLWALLHGLLTSGALFPPIP